MRAFPKFVGFVYFLLTCLLGWSALEAPASPESTSSAQQTASLDTRSDAE